MGGDGRSKDPRWWVRRTIKLSDGRVHVVRWDKIVHIVERSEGPLVFDVDKRGHPTVGSFRVHTFCGRTAKMYIEGENRFVETYPTCVRCVGAKT
jgi:hypothetical protein